jgi:aryl-alcohol dehydrogenase-like predicted oxidoreductase
MEYRRLGRSGLKVSEICLGTMTFGHGTNTAEAERMVAAALDAGVMFFDTADGYSDGESEVMIGSALGARRRDAVIATKVFNAMGPGPNDSGMSRSHIMTAVEDSLRRLGTDYIDLYLQHRHDPSTALDETLGALSDLIHQGKVRVIGSSTFPAELIMEALWV